MNRKFDDVENENETQVNQKKNTDFANLKVAKITSTNLSILNASMD